MNGRKLSVCSLPSARNNRVFTKATEGEENLCIGYPGSYAQREEMYATPGFEATVKGVPHHISQDFLITATAHKVRTTCIVNHRIT